MTKSVKVSKSVEDLPNRKFKIGEDEYLVFTKDDDIRVELKGEIVFDKKKSKISYIQWIKTIKRPY